jgi:membrane protein YdbS with pleckstrin-like domain
VGDHRALRDGEHEIVSVTPVAEGLTGPIVAMVLATGVVLVADHYFSWARREALLLSLVLVAPCAALLAMRAWRWRSHRVTITDQRVLSLSGITHRRRSSVELIDVVAVRVDQRWLERPLRRGEVTLETAAGPFELGSLRHPDALARVIEYERELVDRRDRARLDEADELARALEAGEITDQEHDERWRRLFGRGPAA